MSRSSSGNRADEAGSRPAETDPAEAFDRGSEGPIRWAARAGSGRLECPRHVTMALGAVVMDRGAQ